MGVAEQNAMAALNRQQQAAIDEITLQRNQARVQYETAVAQAIADNDIERARALYEEAVRVDNSWRSELEDLLLQQQYQMNQLSMEATRQQMELERQAYQAALTGGSGGGGGGGGDIPVRDPGSDPGDGNPATPTTVSTAEFLSYISRIPGLDNNGKRAIIDDYVSNGRLTQEQAASIRQTMGLSANADTLGINARSLLMQLSAGNLSSTEKVARINSSLSNGRISEAEASYLMDYLGY